MSVGAKSGRGPLYWPVPRVYKGRSIMNNDEVIDCTICKYLISKECPGGIPGDCRVIMALKILD